jgi:hypothetical protein
MAADAVQKDFRLPVWTLLREGNLFVSIQNSGQGINVAPAHLLQVPPLCRA